MALLANSFAAAVRLSCHRYRCGQQGHMKANCPCKSNSLGTRQKQTTLARVGNCNQCRKPGHFAKQCKSKFHINGQPVNEQGNGNKSTKGKRMPTQAPSPSASLCDQLTRRTRGSASLDVSTTDTITIDSLDMHKFPLGAMGLLGEG